MPKKILIVDDEPDLLKVVEFRLSKAGYETITVTDGKQALERLAEINPDLILLDFRMPYMDGGEVCKRIKADERFKKIPVILMTASNEGAIAEKAKTLGFDDGIVKPFQHRELFQKIENLLRQATGGKRS